MDIEEDELRTRLENITDDSEEIVAAVANDSGVVRTSGDRSQHVDLAVGLAVTDRRIVFTALEGGGGADTGALSYGDLAGIDVDEGRLEFTTTDGVVWKFPLDGPDSDAADALGRHLRWIGSIRSRVVSTRNDVELAAGEIHSHADDLNWENALATYRRARDELDDLICVVQCTDPVDDTALAPELAEIERTLEKARARLSIERARSQLELGRQLVRNEDYQQAHRVLEGAQEQYRTARGRSDAIERGDSFRFGVQRELTNELEDLGWEIETVAAEPIQQAHEAKVQAQNTDDPAKAIEFWETAFRRFGNVLTLEWGDEKRHFAGDPAEMRKEMNLAATRLVVLHERVASELWNGGAALEADGDLQAAIGRCKSATEHVERAHELATEFDPETADELASRLERMFETLIDMRDTVDDWGHDEQVPEIGTEQIETSTDSNIDGERNDDMDWPPSLDDLSEIDTHHDITFDVEDLGRSRDASEDGKRHCPEPRTPRSDRERQTEQAPNGSSE